ncbi:lipoprotein [Desmospora activa]|uniref:DUF4352 domain-containing protein n=1 Tax=Desmospora activa DSM 45169 TaxID=1121389 RepID=A0A2T4Z935_9BACL|nr:hypothetical protein [Desmospora activa]PTM58403.1 hypothetical protein C8J48_0986 [Desmospora activa DSM 45169]
MKKIGFMAIICLFAFALVGCGPDDVSTGAEDASGNEENKQNDQGKNDGEKRTTVNETKDVGGLKVTVAEVVVREDKIDVGINLENTASHPITIYPDMDGKIVIPDMQMQLTANMFMGDSVGGDVSAGVKQDGVLSFTTDNNKKLTTDEVKSFNLELGEVVHGETYSTLGKIQFEIAMDGE